MNTRMLNLSAAVLALTLLASPGSAALINDAAGNGEPALYEIFNDLFGTSYASSSQLFLERSFLANVHEARDYVWGAGGQGAHIIYAGGYHTYDHRLDYIEDNCWTEPDYGDRFTLLTDDSTPFECVTFDPGPFNFSGSFDFILTANGQDYWSRSTENPGGRDHMVAFDVSDLWADDCGDYIGSYDNAYLLAFEDMDLGDRDYNDFLAIVVGVKPVPEPTSMLLLGLGSLGLAGLRRRRGR